MAADTGCVVAETVEVEVVTFGKSEVWPVDETVDGTGFDEVVGCVTGVTVKPAIATAGVGIPAEDRTNSTTPARGGGSSSGPAAKVADELLTDLGTLVVDDGSELAGPGTEESVTVTASIAGAVEPFAEVTELALRGLLRTVTNGSGIGAA